MKTVYVKDLLNMKEKQDVELLGWVMSIRKGKTLDFIDIVDSTGKISVIANKGMLEGIKRECSVKVCGTLQIETENHIMMESIHLIGNVTDNLTPSPRSKFDVFSNQYADLTIKNKHLYIRNEKEIAILKARDSVLRNIRRWYAEQGYIEITAPILTPSILYGNETAIMASWKDDHAYLTQCVGFYLESAVHAFEKVYNIGPSFRGMESISPRHLMEYWHVKSELAFCSFDEYFDVTESLVTFVAEKAFEECSSLLPVLNTAYYGKDLKRPFPRITYKDAVKLVNEHGIDLEFGRSLNTKAEKFLSEYFGNCVWVVYNPRCVEGFPYKIKKDEPELSMTADLIASDGYGELLGIADKIENVDEFDIRLAEKGKERSDYEWFRQLRTYGTVPHCGMGMGVERLIRWLFGLNHVRDAMPFPRCIGRTVYP